MWSAFGIDMLSKLATNSSNLFGTGELVRERERKDARYDYLQNEREGIQARVEGAKAAGLHPLAALGFQAGASPTTVVGGTPHSTGYQGYQDPVAKQSTDPSLVRINEANARRAEAEADMAELNAHNAYRALATQPGNAPTSNVLLPTDSKNRVESTPQGGLRPGVVIEPDKVTAGINGYTSGTHPAATDVALPKTGKYQRYLTMPSSQFSQLGEDLDLLKYWLVLQANRDSLAKFVVDDVPWATRGYLQDLRKSLGLPPARAFSKKRRGGGATGSW